MPALPGHEDIIRDPLHVVPWSQRRDSRLFWRARSTGVDFHTGRDWRDAHRVRLHFYATNKTGSIELLQEGDRSDDGADDILSTEMDRMSGTELHGSLWLASYPRAELVEKYLDVGLVGPLVQCNEPSPYCENVAEEIGFLGVVPQVSIQN
jgi:beta-1,2-xylosyltransferase